MALLLDDTKAGLLAEAVDVATKDGGDGAVPAEEVPALLEAYYRHVAPADLTTRSPEDIAGAFASHQALAASRPEGTSRVRVFTPTASEQGWSAGGHSVVEIVTDDMAFLVDSMAMALTQDGHGVHVVIHPQFEVRRDLSGELRSVVVPADRRESSEVRNVDDSGQATLRESWMHLEIDRVADAEEATRIERELQDVLRDVRDAVEDWPRMQGLLRELVRDIEAAPPASVDAGEVQRGVELLQWLADDHFAFLGFREYDVVADGEDLRLQAVPGSGLGILRSDQSSPGRPLTGAAREQALEPHLLVLTKANSRSTVHRSAYLDYIGIKRFDADGKVVGERRFLGLFSSAAYTDSVLRIPMARDKVADVLASVDLDPSSHAGKAVVNVLETYPRDELFYAASEDLEPIAEAVMLTRDPRQLRLFLRREPYGRYVSCLIYLARDRYNTGVRERFAEILRRELDADTIDFTVSMSEAAMAQVHFVVRPRAGETLPEVDTEHLEHELASAARSWRDDLAAALSSEVDHPEVTDSARDFLGAFPEAYKEDYDPWTGAADVTRIAGLGERGLDLALEASEDPGQARLKIYRAGEPLSLSRVLPAISSLGVEVTDERPYELEGLARPTWIYDFGVHYSGQVGRDGAERFTDTLRAIWEDRNEVDGFNALVLAAGITWRQATVLRAYAKYMKQGNSPFATDSIEEALAANVDLTKLLVELFETRFNPELSGDRDEQQRVVEERFAKALDDVSSLDHDRILRSYLTHIRATLRTNYFQHDRDGELHPAMSFKLDPSAIPDLPAPRPTFEIFVYSPRVEGVHLRFGSVARGGLRWSDRRDDFRTEILGLVKAQMVKNTVIVPVGAKGGFYCKQLPDPGDRDAWLAEGIACYTTFISGLLDVTDNLVDGEPVPPAEVVRHDGDDTYLVVAADKGTATFSDIANGIAEDYGFWLGDAFASGGSVGYDHKAMGITARGAWVSVQRHFREMGVDCQSEEFTCVGIGDMSGDVFGNGLLCSQTTKLIAAFDHRDIFLDPNPDAATSYAERLRLFELPRSSWQDYDKTLISTGGGVYPRSAKSIPISPEVRQALGLEDGVESLTPAELMRAVLLAPADLLWNGGIGTYVKASAESNADAGDKSNDAIRVDGADLRVRCVGEGGNLGLTQLGRIEYARRGCGGKGGRINTDFIDNSAGVDTSDHEVNIKILLDGVIKSGELSTDDRNTLLAQMTDEVADLVLRDNYEQNLALANAEFNAVPLLHVHEDWMRKLERDGWIDRELEGLPSSREVRRRLDRGQGLSQPEMSVLLAWTKIVLAEELLASDLPEDPFLRADLIAYFPAAMRQDYRQQMFDHPLRREIIVTQVVNDLVNGAGLTFWPRLAGETGASAADLTNANFVAREIFGSLALRDELKTYDNKLPAHLQTKMRVEMRTLCERASRWLVNHYRPPLDSEAIVEFFEVRVQRLMRELPDLLTGGEKAAFERRRDKLVYAGVPEDLATRVAALNPAYMLLDIVQTADREGLDPAEVARVHFVLGERLGIPGLVGRILDLPRDDRWQTMARAALRDDLYAVHTQLTAQAIAASDDDTAAGRVAAWEDHVGVTVERSAETLREICRDDRADLARMSVGLRVVRGLLS